jgi:hypothetical protein
MLGNFLGHLEFRKGFSLLDHVVGSGLARGVPDVVGPIVCSFVAIPVVMTADVFGRLFAKVGLHLDRD